MGRVKRPRRGRPPGLRDIAEKLGVSIGTVYRGLHGRDEISPETRARVLAAAETLGYRPNLAARALSTERRLRIAVNLPREIASFWDLVREGVLDAARPFALAGVELVHYSYPRLGEGEKGALEQALRDDVQGVILAPGLPDELTPLMDQAARHHLPLVCVSTDAPRAARLAAVVCDPLTNGALVGELMGRFLGGRGRVLLVTGQVGTLDHAHKVVGFRRSVAQLWPGLEVADVVEAHDDETEAYEKSRDLLARNGDLAGVYVSTANSVPVVRAIRDAGLARRLTLITTDLFPGLVPYIESGEITATIDQRPWVQGQVAFQGLYRFLAEGLRPAGLVRLPPHVVMRSNLELFLDALRGVPELGRIAEPASP